MKCDSAMIKLKLSVFQYPLILLVSLLLSTVTTGQKNRDSTKVRVAPDSSSIDESIPIISFTNDEFDSQVESQDISGILQSSRDVFTSTAGFTFGAARFRIRGYQSDMTRMMINGIPMNDLETGWGTWYKWGGLNDVTRYSNVHIGINPTETNFGGIGGYTNMNFRATNMYTGSRVSYAYTNRAYRHRVMASHSTGMMENGWAFAASGSFRYAEEGYVPGSSYNAASYYLAAEKRINNQHSLNFTVWGSPSVVGRQSLAVQEAYDLTGNNYYNSYWGYQTDPETGEQVKRNTRVRNTHIPIAIITHDWTINQETNTKLSTSIMGSYGRSGQTRLNWFDAKDPRPDYYRYLPSYYAQTDPSQAATLTDAWQNDPNTSQVNWDRLHNANYKNLYTVDNANGSGQQEVGNRSKYILEESRRDEMSIGFHSHLTHNFSDDLKFAGGLNFVEQRKYNFQVVDDLLGGDYWLNVDQFAQRDFEDDEAAQNNLETPNQTVEKGERFGYDYTTVTQKTQLFGQLEYVLPKIEFYGGLELSNTNFWRIGNVRNGRFPEESFGASEKNMFLNPSAKAGVEYKITGRNYITVNGAFMSRAPTARNSFISPRTRESVIDDLTSEKIFSGDISYHARYSKVKIRATAFYTEIHDMIWSRVFYHDEFRNLVNYNMSGVDQVHMGAELGAEIEVWNGISVVGVAALGDYRYNSRPTATISVDNSSELVADNRTVYWKNYRVGGMPQSAYSFGIKYFGSNYLFAGINFNYFMDIYLDPNPDRRTAEAVETFVESDPQWNQVLDQTKLDDGFTMNAYVGKSFKVGNSKYLNFNINATNILNTQDFRIGGFEQLRYDSQNIDRFPPRVSYMFGFNVFAMVTFRF